jgi:hypothetical protein
MTTYAIGIRNGSYYVVPSDGEAIRFNSYADAQFYVFQKTGKSAFQQANPELYKNEGLGLKFFGSRK